VEAEAAAAAAADAKKVRAKEKKEAQRQRARLRAAVGDLAAAPGVGGPSLGPGSLADAVDDLCAALGATALSTLADAAADAGVPAPDRAAAVREAVKNLAELKAAEAAAKEADRAARAAAEAADAAGAARARAAEWGAEEVRLLQKALTKFPAGTPKRWEAVAAAVRTRSVNEVIDMVKHGLASGKFAAPSTAAFAAPVAKGAAAAGIASAASTRAEAFTDVDVPLAGDAAAVLGGEGGGGGGAAADATSPAKAAPASPAASPTSATAAPEAPWTEAQELALVRALKAHGKDAADRWDLVAGEVAGKTKAECVRRFKALKEGLKAKKAGGA
jgi:DnaJ family protein C protein 2